MNNTETRLHLEKKGYKITFCMSGSVIARKGNMSYKAPTITAVYKMINT